MTFERRESFFGFPTGRWHKVPTGSTVAERAALDLTVGNIKLRPFGVKITTNVTVDQCRLVVTTVTTTQSGMTSDIRAVNVATLTEGSEGKIKVFTGAPCHRVIFRAAK